MSDWNKERIQTLIRSSDVAVERAVLAIYRRQTREEQAVAQTRERNKVGFSAFDAEFCTSMAQRVEAGFSLSPKMISVTRNKVLRYHRQLAEIANARAVEPRIIRAEAAVDAEFDQEIQRLEAKEEDSRMRHKFLREESVTA